MLIPKRALGQHPLLRPGSRSLGPEKVWSLTEGDTCGLFVGLGADKDGRKKREPE